MMATLDRERKCPEPTAKVFSLYVCFFAVFGVFVPGSIWYHYWTSYYPQDFYRMQRLGGDYVATYEASRSILQGRSIYKRYDDTADWSAAGEAARYSYPPPQAYLLAPLALLPFEDSYGVWIGLSLALTEAAREALAEEGYDPQFGARPLKRVIQRRLENPLATKLLGGDFQTGDAIGVDYEGKTFTFNRIEAAKGVEAEEVTKSLSH